MIDTMAMMWIQSIASINNRLTKIWEEVREPMKLDYMERFHPFLTIPRHFSLQHSIIIQRKSNLSFLHRCARHVMKITLGVTLVTVKGGGGTDTGSSLWCL
jgi:hypothetical protein